MDGGRGPRRVAVLERDEGHDVECTQAGVDTRVADERDALGDRGRESGRGGGRVFAAGTREREHAAVVIRVRVQVEQRVPARVRERREHRRVAPFRNVGDAFEHGEQATAR